MKTNQLKKYALILGAAILLQGCAAVVGTTVAVATKVATDPRTVGTQIDDETLEEKILFAINKDQQLKTEARINVVSYSGQVLLIGQVPNHNLKELATQLTEGVEGTKKIYNEIRLGKKIPFTQISKDSWITTQIKTKIFTTSTGVKATDVKVITENNEVFLMGNLTQQQADAATEIARRVSGVSKVVKVFNYLK